jgi:hypothetical protein
MNTNWTAVTTSGASEMVGKYFGMLNASQFGFRARHSTIL